MLGTASRRLVATLSVMGAAGASGEVADAAVLQVSETSVTYRAAPGERNSVTLSRFGSYVIFREQRVPIAIAGDPDACKSVSPQAIACILGTNLSGQRPRLRITVGDRDDQVFASSGVERYEVSGGGGTDSFNYAFQNGVESGALSLDDRANDGAPGERANVLADIENLSVSGVVRTVRVIGNNHDNVIDAQQLAVPVTVDARGGDDTLHGRGTFNGGPGRDTLWATGGGEFSGGPGKDYLYKAGLAYHGAPARFYGGPGNDRIYSADSTYTAGLEEEGTTATYAFRDRVKCSAGSDVVFADRLDYISRDCEAKRRFADDPLADPRR